MNMPPQIGLAAHLRQHLDLEQIYDLLQLH